MVSKNLPSGNNAFMKSFKNLNEKSEVEYKISKNRFESIKKPSTKYVFLILFLNTNII